MIRKKWRTRRNIVNENGIQCVPECIVHSSWMVANQLIYLTALMSLQTANIEKSRGTYFILEVERKRCAKSLRRVFANGRKCLRSMRILIHSLRVANIVHIGQRHWTLCNINVPNHVFCMAFSFRIQSLYMPRRTRAHILESNVQ